MIDFFFSADIEVHLDALGRPVNLQSQRGEGESCTKLAILIGPAGHYRRNSHELLGVHVMKRRQLKIAGYEIVEVASLHIKGYYIYVSATEVAGGIMFSGHLSVRTYIRPSCFVFVDISRTMRWFYIKLSMRVFPGG